MVIFGGQDFRDLRRNNMPDIRCPPISSSLNLAARSTLTSITYPQRAQIGDAQRFFIRSKAYLVAVYSQSPSNSIRYALPTPRLQPSSM